MRKPELKRITAALRQLAPDQRKSVAAELAALDAQPASTELIEGRFACGATCPYCKAMHVIRNGHANRLQRYRCRECCKTFSALTGTPLNRLHKRSGLDRKSRKRGEKTAQLGLPHEQVPVLVARDRGGAAMDCVLEAMVMATLSVALKPFLTKDVVLCTDGSKAFAGAARKIGIEHHAVNLSAGIRVDGAWHVQNVNAYNSRFKACVQKFRGVATCYLVSHLGWFRALDRKKGDGPKPQQWLAMAIGETA